MECGEYEADHVQSHFNVSGILKVDFFSDEL